MIVVSDTSCISNLLTINQCHLLAKLFGEIIIPPAVERELLRFHQTVPSYVRTQVPLNGVRVAELEREVDKGEAEAICLALELTSTHLLIDERIGRKVALREGLKIIGIVGVLITAKRKNLISSVEALLNQLEADAGFRLAPNLKLTALAAADEAPK
jgi:uncharacterized protein